MNFYKKLTLDEIIDLLLSGEKSLSEVTRNYKDTEQVIIDRFKELGYYKVEKGKKIISCAKYKYAADKYIELGGFPNTNITEIAKEFKISPNELSDYISTYYPDIKILGKANFNEYIFDSIDTEEKAYWLGFIFADGAISSSPIREGAKTQYQFELSLSNKDLDHLKKFAKFIEYKQPLFCDETRCRLSVYSKHLWQVLNVNGCTPQKSLTLKFPRIELFKNKDLIKHFIRGYWDGDGCLTWSDKDHTRPEISVLGTDEMLYSIISYLPLTTKPILKILHPEKQSITKYFSLTGEKAYVTASYLYNNSIISLQRKYNKYLEYCRLYEKPYRGLEDNIGEGCDANPEITKESNESLVS